MRLDASYLDYLTREEFRVLVAIEMGMKNHEFVPVKLINSIANLKTGNTYKIIKRLLKLKFIQHVSIKYDGYKLNYSGYDYLALQTFVKRGTITEVVGKLGVGKESDIYTCLNGEGQPVVLKFTRLGRTSFRTIKLNRDYIKNRTSYNWLYLSRISSTKEYTFMQKLYEAGFPTPVPLDWNRHGVVMSLIDGPTLIKLVQLGDCERVFKQTLDLLIKFAEHGLIHSDFNEFNLILDAETQDIRVIDFPQCVSTSHHNAEFYFNRDVECIYTFFDRLSQKCESEKEKGFNVADYPMPELKNIVLKKSLDVEVKASGHLDQIKHEEINWRQLEEYEEFMRGLKRDPKVKGEVEEVGDSEEDEQEEIDESERNFEEQKELQGNTVAEMAKEVEKEIQEMKGEEKEGEEEEQESESESQDEQQQQRFKGMTQYQIRQILKEQKLKARSEKKKGKQEENVHDLIKQIARRKPRENKKITKNKNKGINKVNPYDIMM